MSRFHDYAFNIYHFRAPPLCSYIPSWVSSRLQSGVETLRQHVLRTFRLTIRDLTAAGHLEAFPALPQATSMLNVYSSPAFQPRPASHLPSQDPCRIEIRLDAFDFRQQTSDVGDTTASRQNFSTTQRIPPCMQCATFGDAPCITPSATHAATSACPALFWRRIRLRGLRASFRHLDHERFVLLPSPATSQSATHCAVDSDAIVSPFDVDARVSCLDSHDPSAAHLPITPCHVLVSFAASPHARSTNAEFSADVEPLHGLDSDDAIAGSDFEAFGQSGDCSTSEDARAGIDFTIRDHDLVALNMLIGALKHCRASDAASSADVECTLAEAGSTSAPDSERRFEGANADADYEIGACTSVFYSECICHVSDSAID